ncbi:MAG: class aldolase/adducin family protein [Acidimicrobiales bacterium]|nr:class aldolase/adducin family protein [Acidimicrobiales bacterium]
MGNPMAPSLPDLTPRGEVALLARILYREGYDDHLAGHITSKLDDDTLLVNPFGMPWDEVRAADIMRIDLDGNVLEGPWTVTPAITLHLELHKMRHEVGVAVHNHPRWGTIWADIGRVPEIYDQTAAMYHGDVALYADYPGPVNEVANAQDIAKVMGSANICLLANHGVLVVGPDIRFAYLRSAVFEWRCRQAWHVAAAGGGHPMRPDVAAEFGEMFNHVPFPGLFDAMARRELRADPTILEE